MKYIYILLAALSIFGDIPADPVSVEVPIIMYHKVTKDQNQHGKLAITPEELAEDFQFLAESDYTPVTMTMLIDYAAGTGALPARPIVLTFDDGHFSDHMYLLPLATRYKIPVVSSIIGITTDVYTKEGRTDILYPHVTWPQVQEMANSGWIELQNHGYDLHDDHRGGQGAKKRPGEDKTAYAKRLGDDLMRLQNRMQTMIGTQANTFTYPFGATSEESDDVLKSLGFQASLLAARRKNIITKGDPDSLFGLGRLIRPHGKRLQDVLADQ